VWEVLKWKEEEEWEEIGSGVRGGQPQRRRGTREGPGRRRGGGEAQ